MIDKEVLDKVRKKKEFSHLPEEDIKKAFSHFKKRQTSEEEKIRLTRELLHKVFGAFGSRKLLVPKKEAPDWFLKKHLSTRERSTNYKKIYKRLLKGMNKKLTVIDLGSGINGFSYPYFKKAGFEVDYVGVEAVGQFVDLMNASFHKEKWKAKAIHTSLFNILKIKEIISKTKRPRVIFLFKVIDSLELLERNFSKNLLLELKPLCDWFIVSFATASMIKRKKFLVQRRWFRDFLKDNFDLLDEFEVSGENYFIFKG